MATLYINPPLGKIKVAIPLTYAAAPVDCLLCPNAPVPALVLAPLLPASAFAPKVTTVTEALAPNAKLPCVKVLYAALSLRG